ncbi:hypothetical protein D3C72_1437360 [compost metagenome]
MAVAEADARDPAIRHRHVHAGADARGAEAIVALALGVATAPVDRARRPDAEAALGRLAGTRVGLSSRGVVRRRPGRRQTVEGVVAVAGRLAQLLTQGFARVLVQAAVAQVEAHLVAEARAAAAPHLFKAAVEVVGLRAGEAARRVGLGRDEAADFRVQRGVGARLDRDRQHARGRTARIGQGVGDAGRSGEVAFGGEGHVIGPVPGDAALGQGSGSGLVGDADHGRADEGTA